MLFQKIKINKKPIQKRPEKNENYPVRKTRIAFFISRHKVHNQATYYDLNGKGHPQICLKAWYSDEMGL